MSTTLKVLRHEITMQISRPSFWIFSFSIPVLALIFLAGTEIRKSLLPIGSRSAAASPLNSINQLLSPQEGEPRPQGYVDMGGMIKGFPKYFQTKKLLAFADQAEAQRALESGKIDVYFVIPADYLQNGKILAFMNEYDLASAQNSDELVRLINYNLLGENETLLRHISNPLENLEETNLAPKGSDAARQRNNMSTLMLAYGAMSLLMMSILGSASLMLSSLASEKENRVIEILMISATPNQLIMGKIIALGLLGLGQTLIWATSSVISLRFNGGADFKLPTELMVNPAIIGWGCAFFVLGYLSCAALMAGIGVLVPNMREASQISTYVALPIMTPMFLIALLVDAPNGTLAMILSLFPVTAPLAMILRLSLVSVPLWQLLLSVALLAAYVVLLIRSVSRLFRAQTILTGVKFQWKKYFLALAGRA